MQRLQQLQQLVRDSQYEVDEHSVADAIIARATAHRAVMEAMFRYDAREHPGPGRAARPAERDQDLELILDLELDKDPEVGQTAERARQDPEPGKDPE